MTRVTYIGAMLKISPDSNLMEWTIDKKANSCMDLINLLYKLLRTD
jgi:hypothetical protein